MGPMFENMPTPYGKVHIYSLIISLITFVIFFMMAKKRNDKKDRIVVFVVSCLLIATEIWKQVTRYNELGRYDFAIFPAQLCSIPMFLGFIQVFINIAVVIGLLPITGITLPIVSYGGSSLIITLTSLGLLLNISKYQE